MKTCAQRLSMFCWKSQISAMQSEESGGRFECFELVEDEPWCSNSVGCDGDVPSTEKEI